MRARFIRSLLLVAVLTLSSVLATAAAGPARQSAAQRPTSAGRPVLTVAEGGVASSSKALEPHYALSPSRLLVTISRYMRSTTLSTTLPVPENVSSMAILTT